MSGLKSPPPPMRPPEALTLHGVLAGACASNPGGEALVFDDPLAGDRTVHLTYSELEAQTGRVAAALVARGLAPGERVGVLLGNRPEAVAAFFGISTAGGVVVPLSTFSTPAELAYMVERADIGTVITQTSLRHRRFPEDLPPGRDLVVVGDGTWEAFLDSGAETNLPAVTPSDPALVIFTSGTTEHPKGILHTHGSTALQFWHQARIFGRTRATRMWTALPVFWTAGFSTAMGGTIAAGGCWVMQETFEPGPAIELMARERVTEPYTLPHQTAELEEEPGWADADFSAMRCVYGKSAFARHRRVTPDSGWMMPIGYGLSETNAFFSAHGFDVPRDLRKQSTGRLLPGNELRVVDFGTGADLGPGEEGELAVRGPTLMTGYLGRRPSDCFDEAGFFRTGDAGSYDEGGYLHWEGRRTEMIKTAGANVSPAELEVALRACAPVKLARALGVDDSRRGEQVVLCVVLKEGAVATEADIRGFLAERLAAYKVPKRVLFVHEQEVPMTASRTKVRDDELRALVTQRLGE